MIVGPEPRGGNLPDLFEAFENVEVRPFVPNRLIVALNIGVLLALAGLDLLGHRTVGVLIIAVRTRQT